MVRLENIQTLSHNSSGIQVKPPDLTFGRVIIEGVVPVGKNRCKTQMNVIIIKRRFGQVSGFTKFHNGKNQFNGIRRSLNPIHRTKKPKTPVHVFIGTGHFHLPVIVPDFFRPADLMLGIQPGYQRAATVSSY
ncbi:hypothetical protein D3C86_1756660 [compost metagenome]